MAMPTCACGLKIHDSRRLIGLPIARKVDGGGLEHAVADGTVCRRCLDLSGWTPAEFKGERVR